MPTTSRAKRGLFVTILVLLVWAFAELVAGLVLWRRDGGFPGPSRLSEMRQAASEEPPPVALAGVGEELRRKPGQQFPEEALHPYLGFVLDPASAQGRARVSAQGFLQVYGPREQPPEGQLFEVGIFGGSVATGFCFGSRRVFTERLERSGLTAGRRVYIHCLALGGYKQPQQLMALQWFLAQGKSFDLVLLIDGFNEVALPFAENLPQRMNPLYPRSWRHHARRVMSPELLRRAGEVEFLRARRRDRAGLCGWGPLAMSPLCHLAWSVWDQRVAARLVELDTLHEAEPPSGKGFSSRGPKFQRSLPQELFPELARLWGESSRLMHQTLAARGVPYFHFLQPNQYFEGSKPMGAAEKRLAVVESSPYRIAVQEGYPRLIAVGRELRESGLAFTDLTRLFAGHSEPLYMDSCCHYNQAGNDLLGEAVAKVVLTGLADRGAGPR